MAPNPSPSGNPARAAGLPFYTLVYVASVGGAYWVNFIWFYMTERWGRDDVRNLAMNAAFGLLYTAGCWRTARVSAYASPRGMLIGAYALLILMTLVSPMLGSPLQLMAVILLHSYVIARTWPNLEMLATAGKRGPALGRAIGLYNLGWSSMSAIAYAAAGRLYQIHPATLFLVPCLFWGGAILLVRALVSPRDRPLAAMPVPQPEALEPPRDAGPLAESMRSLTRLGNMGCYILISVLVPITPSITARLGLDTGEATAFGSLWQAGRVAAFIFFSRWHGWHFRPGMFLAFALALPALFGLTAISPVLWVAAAAQLLLGFALGMVYTSALFYSMHGEANTSEAAIHELVIGLGIMAGPLLAAACGAAGRYWGAPDRGLIVGSAIAVMLGIWGVMAARAARARAAA